MSVTDLRGMLLDIALGKSSIPGREDYVYSEEKRIEAAQVLALLEIADALRNEGGVVGTDGSQASS